MITDDQLLNLREQLNKHFVAVEGRVILLPMKEKPVSGDLIEERFGFKFIYADIKESYLLFLEIK